jgi:hypothetical protein
MGVILNFSRVNKTSFSIFLCSEKTKKQYVYLGKYVKRLKSEKYYMPSLCYFKFDVFLQKYLTRNIIMKDRDFKVIYKMLIDE